MTLFDAARPEPAPAASGAFLDIDALAAADVRDWPFRHTVAHGLLSPALKPALSADFPKIQQTGFFQVETLGFGPAFAQLVAELQAPAFSRIVGEKLGVDLLGRPRMVTVRKWSAGRDGRPHTDGADKVATALLYLNPDWTGQAGALRYLTGPDVESVGTAAIAPLFGAFTAFARTDTSWHGHPPFTGERRVIQVFWVQDQAAAERKTRRHGRQTFWRRLRSRVSGAPS